MAERNAALVPLSWDHHHGLALALRLQQGEGALLSDGWTHDPAEQAERVLEYFESELRIHFACEEQILFPVVRAFAPDASPLLDRLIQDHRDIVTKVMGLGSKDHSMLRQELASIGTTLKGHIRTEERMLFPLCESRLSESALNTLGRDLLAMRGGSEQRSGA
jgi:iron-sulfur cluster repair protein YtfE (RIC family)